MIRQSTEWKNIFANHICDKGLISKTYKELMVKKHMKRCLASLIIREMQIKIMRYHLTHIRRVTINFNRNPENNKDWQGYRETGILMHC